MRSILVLPIFVVSCAAASAFGLASLYLAWGHRYAVAEGADLPTWVGAVALVAVAVAARIGPATSSAAASVRCTAAALLALLTELLWAPAAPSLPTVSLPVLAGAVGVPALLVGGAAASLGRGPSRAAAAVGVALGMAGALLMGPLMGASATGSPGWSAGELQRAGVVGLLLAGLCAAGWTRAVRPAVDWYGAAPALAVGLLLAALHVVVWPEVLMDLADPWRPWGLGAAWVAVAAGAFLGGWWSLSPAWCASAAAVALALTLHRHGQDPGALQTGWLARGLLAPALLGGAALGAVGQRRAPMALPLGLSLAVGVVGLELLAAGPLTHGAVAWGAEVFTPRHGGVIERLMDPALVAGLVMLVVLLGRGFAGWVGLLVLGSAFLLGLSGGGAPWAPWTEKGPRLGDDRGVAATAWQTLDRNPRQTLRFDRRRHQLSWSERGTTVERWGARAVEAELLAQVPALLASGTGRALVFGSGSERVVRGLEAWSIAVEAVPTEPVALDGLDRDGPGPLGMRRLERGATAGASTSANLWRGVLPAAHGPRSHLRQRPEGSADLLTWRHPLPRGAEGWLTVEAQREARRVVGSSGHVAVALRLGERPTATLAAAVLAAATAHGSVQTYLVADVLLVVGGPDSGGIRACLGRAPDGAWPHLHDLGVVTAEDFARAHLALDLSLAGDPLRQHELPVVSATIAAPPTPDAVAADLAWLLQRTQGADRQRLELRLGRSLPRAIAAEDPRSVLAGRELLQAQVRALLAAGQGDPRRAGDGARALYPRAHGSASLWALMAWPSEWPNGRKSTPTAEEALIAACTLDPLLGKERWLRHAPELAPFASLLDRPFESPLEDFGRWPGGGDGDREGRAELVRAAADQGPLGVALRGRQPQRCARALVAAMGVGPLTDGQRWALATVVDGWTLDRAVSSVVERDGDLAAEVLPLWRRDLAVPERLHELVAGTREQRVALADALHDRESERARALLAELMVDRERAVRQAALAALSTLDSEIPFDPDGSIGSHRAAADALRAWSAGSDPR